MNLPLQRRAGKNWNGYAGLFAAADLRWKKVLTSDLVLAEGDDNALIGFGSTLTSYLMFNQTGATDYDCELIFQDADLNEVVCDTDTVTAGGSGDVGLPNPSDILLLKTGERLILRVVAGNLNAAGGLWILNGTLEYTGTSLSRNHQVVDNVEMFVDAPDGSGNLILSPAVANFSGTAVTVKVYVVTDDGELDLTLGGAVSVPDGVYTTLFSGPPLRSPQRVRLVFSAIPAGAPMLLIADGIHINSLNQ